MRRICRATSVLLLTIAFVVMFQTGEAAATSIGLLRNDYDRDGVSDLVGIRPPTDAWPGGAGTAAAAPPTSAMPLRLEQLPRSRRAW